MKFFPYEKQKVEKVEKVEKNCETGLSKTANAVIVFDMWLLQHFYDMMQT